MTQHKHLKQLIRERMHKTGERYVAARRSVLQTTPNSDLPHRPGCNPGATALRILLANAGIHLSEAMVFGIAGGVGIGVFTFCYEKEDFASFFIAGRHCWHDHLVYLQRAAERFGTTNIVKEASSAKAAEKALREMLDAHGTCVAWVDLGALTYRGLPPSPMTAGYHLLTVYNASATSATIGDLTDDPIEVAMADLTVARGRIKKDKYRLLALEANRSGCDIQAAVTSGLRACRDGLDGSDGPTNARQNFSLNALPVWANRLTAHGKDSWEKVFPSGRRLFTGLTSLCQYIEYYGAGGGLARPLMSDFLDEAGKQLNNSQLAELAAKYRNIAENWSQLADLALPDNVAILGECKRLFEQYAELCHSHGSLDEKRQCWFRLRQLEQEAAIEFPLTSSQSAELRAAMAERVLSIHLQEAAARQYISELCLTG